MHRLRLADTVIGRGDSHAAAGQALSRTPSTNRESAVGPPGRPVSVASKDWRRYGRIVVLQVSCSETRAPDMRMILIHLFHMELEGREHIRIRRFFANSSSQSFK